MNNNISETEDKKEYFDDEFTLDTKISLLAEMISKSNYLTFFTGAGVSTGAGIPDFRSSKDTVLETGPGKWEKAALGINDFKPKKQVMREMAFPTKAHMAIVQLFREGKAKFLISQNTDGLHRKSGVLLDQMAELHGNCNLEKCIKCGTKYMRDYTTRTAKTAKEHLTGRICDDVNCGGELADSIINFSESLPEDELNKAYTHTEKTDLMICLGSSLRVYPAADMPKRVRTKKKNLVIVNLQKTPLNDIASLVIHAQIDTVMQKVMEKLKIPIPKWTFTRNIVLNFLDNEKLLVRGADVDGKEFSIFKKVILRIKNRCFTKCKPPLEFGYFSENDNDFELALTFQGYYSEPEYILQLAKSNFEVGKPLIIHLQFDPFELKWTQL